MLTQEKVPPRVIRSGSSNSIVSHPGSEPEETSTQHVRVDDIEGNEGRWVWNVRGCAPPNVDDVFDIVYGDHFTRAPASSGIANVECPVNFMLLRRKGIPVDHRTSHFADLAPVSKATQSTLVLLEFIVRQI